MNEIYENSKMRKRKVFGISKKIMKNIDVWIRARDKGKEKLPPDENSSESKWPEDSAD